MILESAMLNITPGSSVDFEAAFAKASRIIASSPGFRSLKLLRCLEDDHRYLLLVGWARLEDHTQGFRQSPAYLEWKALLHHFYDPFPTVEHFGLVTEISSP